MSIEFLSRTKRPHVASTASSDTLGSMGLVACVCVAGLVLTGFLAAGALLAAPSEAPRYVDAVAVLGGDHTTGGRYARGSDLVLAGYSKRLIILDPSTVQIDDANSRMSRVKFVYSTSVQGSWGEAIAVRGLMQAEGLRSVMVVSDPPHMLRLTYTWGSIFRSTGLDYVLVATSPPWWSNWLWWRNADAADFVGNEVLKLGYYLMKYRFDL